MYGGGRQHKSFHEHEYNIVIYCY